MLGRLDDAIKVSGHRIGTMEVESAIVSHPNIAEAAIAPFSPRNQGKNNLDVRYLNARCQKVCRIEKRCKNAC